MSKVPRLLQNLHISAASIHLVSCILAIVVHTDTITGKITLPHHTYMADPTATEKHLIVNETTTHEPILYTNPMVWIAANEGFTFFSHILALFLMPRANNLNDFERTRRTLEYSFTAGILQVALVLGVGSVAIYDVLMLLLINVAVQLLGWLWDKTNDDFIKPYLLGIAFGLLSVEIIYVIGQSLNLNGIEPGGYIVMGIFYAIFYLMFGLVKCFKSWRNHENELYILMSVSSKVALSWILIGNTYQGLRELKVDSAPLDHTDLDWGVVQYIITFVCGLILLIGIPIIVNLPVNDYMTAMDMEDNEDMELLRKKRKNFDSINF